MINTLAELEAKNYYEILEVTPGASQKEIEDAYRRSLFTYSSDSPAIYSLMTNEDCENIQREIEQAYSILSRPDKRAEYNKVKGIEESFEELEKTDFNHFEEAKKPVVKKYTKAEFEYSIDFGFEQKIEQTAQFTGSFLKEIREYKNVSLDMISEYTRILKTYLVFIESEEFDKLPATAYIRGFVFQYAKYLKLNPDLVSSSYIELVKRHRNEIPLQ